MTHCSHGYCTDARADRRYERQCRVAKVLSKINRLFGRCGELDGPNICGLKKGHGNWKIGRVTHQQWWHGKVWAEWQS